MSITIYFKFIFLIFTIHRLVLSSNISNLVVYCLYRKHRRRRCCV